MDKKELKKLLLEQIDSYENMINENLEKMIGYQDRIQGLQDINNSHIQKVKELTKKLLKLKE